MDRTEAIAEIFLRSIGHTDLRYEPDGNTPPDFSVGGKIGVEVRRLNLADWSNESPKGLEIASYSLAARFEKLLKEFGPAEERSYWVSYTFFRPLASWPDIYPALKDSLRKLVQSKIESPTYLRPATCLEVRIHRTTNVQPYLFNLATFSDAAAGGFVVSEMLKHIEHYAKEKSRKIMPHKARYSSWWLVLVDYIGYGLKADDHADLRAWLSVESEFEKIFVVSPLSPHTGYEI